MVKHAVEANFDGLVGPTHNYAGLSWGGNVASKSNVNAVANPPREAALQGLEKMKRLADRGGYVQGILPPPRAPAHSHPPCAGL